MLTKDTAKEKAEQHYNSGLYCSEAVFLVANEYLGYPVPNNMVRLASGFGVGMGMAGCSCGALTGGVMALGLKFGRDAAGMEMPGMFDAAKELHDRFQARRTHVCCRLLIKNFAFGSAEHLDQCRKITGEVAADVIELLSRNAE